MLDDDQRQDRQFKKCIENYLGDLFNFDKRTSVSHTDETISVRELIDETASSQDNEENRVWAGC